MTPGFALHHNANKASNDWFSHLEVLKGNNEQAKLYVFRNVTESSGKAADFAIYIAFDSLAANLFHPRLRYSESRYSIKDQKHFIHSYPVKIFQAKNIWKLFNSKISLITRRRKWDIKQNPGAETLRQQGEKRWKESKCYIRKWKS